MTAGMLIRCFLATNTSRARDPIFDAMSILLAGPTSVLAFMLIMTYTRLTWWITPPEQRTSAVLWLPPAFQTIVIATPQCIADAIVFFGSGILFIKPAPKYVALIGAIVEAMTWMWFGGIVARFVYISRNKWPMMDVKTQERARQLGMALCTSCVLLLVSTSPRTASCPRKMTDLILSGVWDRAHLREG